MHIVENIMPVAGCVTQLGLFRELVKSQFSPISPMCPTRSLSAHERTSTLVFTLTTINAWNRLAITMRTEVDNYQPKARPVSQTA